MSPQTGPSRVRSWKAVSGPGRGHLSLIWAQAVPGSRWLQWPFAAYAAEGARSCGVSPDSAPDTIRSVSSGAGPTGHPKMHGARPASRFARCGRAKIRQVARGEPQASEDQQKGVSSESHGEAHRADRTRGDPFSRRLRGWHPAHPPSSPSPSRSPASTSPPFPTSPPRSALPPARSPVCPASRSTSPRPTCAHRPTIPTCWSRSTRRRCAPLEDLRPGGTVIINSDAFNKKSLQRAGYESDDDPLVALRDRFQVVEVPVTALNREAIKDLSIGAREGDRSKNFFALGLMYWLYNRPIESTIRWLESRFKGDVLEANIRVLKAGHAFGEATKLFSRSYVIPRAKIQPGTYRRGLLQHQLNVAACGLAR